MRIEDYRFGHLRIDGRDLRKDVLVLPPRVLSPWWRQAGHSLVPADLEEVFADAPEVLVVGTGAYGVMEVPEATRQALSAAGIEVEALRTEEACRRFNALVDQGRRVAAALHLTC